MFLRIGPRRRPQITALRKVELISARRIDVLAPRAPRSTLRTHWRGGVPGRRSDSFGNFACQTRRSVTLHFPVWPLEFFRLTHAAPAIAFFDLRLGCVI